MHKILCSLGIHLDLCTRYVNFTEDGPETPVTSDTILAWLGPVVIEQYCVRCGKVTDREEDWRS